MEIEIVKLLSEQNWGTHVIYVCDTYRIEKHLDAKHMGIFEMRNPYYVERIIDKLIEYQNNQELRKIVSKFK